MINANIDPITLTVVWNGLISIAEEMGSTLRRTAFSEAVREGDDFSTGLFDAEARLVAQGNFTPGHLGSMPYVIRTVLEYFPRETLKPGDAVLLNDSFLGSGHFPDFFMTSPVFVGDRIVGFVVNTAHHVDVGGAAPGSQRVHGVSEAFQEGLRIMPIRLVREGRYDEDLKRMILSNVRMPDKVAGDLNAQLNANRAGAERFAAMFRKQGASRMKAAFDQILAASEARMREFIAAMPDGTYSFDDRIDDYGPGTDPIDVCVDVTIKGDAIEIDFSRSSDQVPAAINSYINYTRAYTVFSIKVFSDALLPHNEGGVRPIGVVARPGSFFNPRFPASSGGRAAVQIRIFDAINGALSQVLPERAMGAFSHWSNPNIGGIDPETGRQFVMYDLSFGGLRRAGGLRRPGGARSGHELPQHPGRGARDQQPGAHPSPGADRGFRRGRPPPRRLRPAQGHRASRPERDGDVAWGSPRVRALRCVRGASRGVRGDSAGSGRGDRVARIEGHGGASPRRRAELPPRRRGQIRGFRRNATAMRCGAILADGFVSVDAARSVYGLELDGGD